jgi:hypothetical protein
MHNQIAYVVYRRMAEWLRRMNEKEVKGNDAVLFEGGLTLFAWIGWGKLKLSWVSAFKIRCEFEIPPESDMGANYALLR